MATRCSSGSWLRSPTVAPTAFRRRWLRSSGRAWPHSRTRSVTCCGSCRWHPTESPGRSRAADRGPATRDDARGPTTAGGQQPPTPRRRWPDQRRAPGGARGRGGRDARPRAATAPRRDREGPRGRAGPRPAHGDRAARPARRSLARGRRSNADASGPRPSGRGGGERVRVHDGIRSLSTHARAPRVRRYGCRPTAGWASGPRPVGLQTQVRDGSPEARARPKPRSRICVAEPPKPRDPWQANPRSRSSGLTRHWPTSGRRRRGTSWSSCGHGPSRLWATRRGSYRGLSGGHRACEHRAPTSAYVGLALTALVQSGHLHAVRGRGGGTFVAERAARARRRARGARRLARPLRRAVRGRAAASPCWRPSGPSRRRSSGSSDLVDEMARSSRTSPSTGRPTCASTSGWPRRPAPPRWSPAMTEAQGAMTDLIRYIAHPPEVLAWSNAQHARLVDCLQTA